MPAQQPDLNPVTAYIERSTNLVQHSISAAPSLSLTSCLENQLALLHSVGRCQRRAAPGVVGVSGRNDAIRLTLW